MRKTVQYKKTSISELFELGYQGPPRFLVSPIDRSRNNDSYDLAYDAARVNHAPVAAKRRFVDPG
jgi:hypothetical protein